MSHKTGCIYDGITREKAEQLHAGGGLTDLGLKTIVDRLGGCPDGCVVEMKARKRRPSASAAVDGAVVLISLLAAIGVFA